MKNLLDKIKPILTPEGIVYQNPKEKETEFIVFLEEITQDPSGIDRRFTGKEGVFGFYAYHKNTGDNYPCEMSISKKIGIPGVHIIVDTRDENKPVDYAPNMNSALEKAHKYILNELIEEILNPNLSGVYLSVLDETRAGIELFNKIYKNNKANLSAEKKTKSKKLPKEEHGNYVPLGGPDDDIMVKVEDNYDNL